MSELTDDALPLSAAVSEWWRNKVIDEIGHLFRCPIQKVDYLTPSFYLGHYIADRMKWAGK